jgi:hypothetical protein
MQNNNLDEDLIKKKKLKEINIHFNFLSNILNISI